MNYLLIVFAFGLFFKSLVLANPLLPKPSSRNKRMIGGVRSSIEEFPYLVSLEYDSTFNCGGAIISPRHILTAAHCMENDDPSSYLVRAGSSYRKKNGTEFELLNFTIHENYTGGSNDLAVLLLKNPIKFDRKKQPIGMFEFGEESKNGSTGTIAGWGVMLLEEDFVVAPTRLRSIKLDIIDKKTCNDSDIKRTSRDGIHEGEICASDLTGFVSTCFGDSGGPLVINSRLAGILSLGYLNCTSWPVPNVFTEVSFFRKWIDEAVKKLSTASDKNV